MPLTPRQTKLLEEILINSLRAKFQNHNPEPASMPFHTRLLGKDRLALYSFIHSLNTNFGTTVFEPVAVALGSNRFALSSKQISAGNRISSDAHHVIQNIMNGLTTATTAPNKIAEIDAIRQVCNKGTMQNVNLTRVDLKLIASIGAIYLIDIKTAKPNAGGFKEFKRTLLEWAAATLADNPEAEVHTLIA
ncbi:MAG: TdeIII family type II restriction endonuclease, partial [Candidatus Cloacimonadaceae bacterium]|nr:TdeIII family type II restriction endonuclease [Candidatus Cloacimonadaceae bacterium]